MRRVRVRSASRREQEASETAAERRNRQSNRRVLLIVGLVMLAVIGWDLYAQLGGR